MSTVAYGMKRERFHEITNKMANKKILVIGDVGVDRYTIGTAARLSPEAPVPVVTVKSQNDKLGMAANVADNIRAFGARPILSSVIGNDRVSEDFFRLLQEAKIDHKNVFSHPSRRTSLKERIIAQAQHVVRIDHEIIEGLSSTVEDFFLERLLPLITGCDAIILEDYAKGVLTDRVVRSIVEYAGKSGVFITVDPTTVVRSLSAFRGVSLFKPNLHEAERLTGVAIRDEASLKKAADVLYAETEAPNIIITQGPKGMTLFSSSSNPVHIPTFARSVYDVSGAGDTVISMLTLAMATGANLAEGAILANFAAGVEVGKQGTATVTLLELEEYMQLFEAFL